MREQAKKKKSLFFFAAKTALYIVYTNNNFRKEFRISSYQYKSASRDKRTSTYKKN